MGTKEIKMMRTFAKLIAPYVPHKYIAAPDMNVGEKEIEAFVTSIGDLNGATGKPLKLKGIPHELGTTGFGVGVALETSLNLIGKKIGLSENLSETRVAIQGFGNVGIGIAKYLAKKGAKVVAISDLWGCVFNKSGIDIEKAEKHSYATSEKQSIKNYIEAQQIPRDDIIKVDCDIFIPCACGDVINKENASLLKAKLIVEGANNAVTPDAEHYLYRRGVIVIPDFLANAGGVIGSYAEYKGMSPEEAFLLIESKIKKNTTTILEGHISPGCNPRKIAKKLADKNIELVLSDGAKKFIAEKGFDQVNGARPLKRVIQKYIEDPIAEEILKGKFGEGNIIQIKMKNKNELTFHVLKEKQKKRSNIKIEE